MYILIANKQHFEKIYTKSINIKRIKKEKQHLKVYKMKIFLFHFKIEVFKEKFSNETAQNP